MRFIYRSWVEALCHANTEAFRTGVRQRVSSVRSVPNGKSFVWQVSSIDEPRLAMSDWAEKLSIAINARHNAAKIREDSRKPTSFAWHRVN